MRHISRPRFERWPIRAQRTMASTLAITATLAILAAYAADPAPQPKSIADEFSGWPKPDAVLMITGQQHGYVEPCGCTGLANQKGGLARRDSLLRFLTEDQGWDVVAVDAGNQVRRFGNQAAIKLQVTTEALRAMQYAAVGLGPDDLRLDLGQILAVVASATDNAGLSDLFACANVEILGFVRRYRVIERGGLKIGVTTALGQEALAKVTHPEVEKLDTLASLQQAIEGMRREQCDFHVLLAIASPAERETWAKQVPGFQLVVDAEGVGDPAFRPERIEGTQSAVIKTGNKAMYVGVVGLYRQSGRVRFRYRRMALDARFPDSPRMLDSLARYQKTLESQGLAGLNLKPVRIGREYVGSERCGDCHSQAYAKWLETPHHHATVAISEPNERSEIPRHHDPECISCHVTGWNPQGYHPYATGYVDLEGSSHLHGNGCENCHGPGKAHVDAEEGTIEATDEQRLALQKQMRLELSRAEEKCIECHDLDNDPKFHSGEHTFAEYWEQIKHPWRD